LTIRRLLVHLASVALLVAVGVAHATVIPVISGDGTETCTQGPALTAGAPCTVHIINDLDTTWQTANPLGRGAEWISYNDTGPLETTLAPPRGSSANPDGTAVIAVFSEALQALAGDVLTLSIWADDTVRIGIDGLTLFQPCFITAGDFLCPATPVAFDPARGGSLQYTFGATGLHTLVFEVYQTGVGTTPNGNPLGLLYSGEFQRAVPEPATVPLVGLGVLALAVVGRRGARRHPLS